MANPEGSDSWSSFEWARWYRDQGFSVVPAHEGAPQGAWMQYQSELASDAQLREWWTGKSLRHQQIFVICGRVSGLVVLDCDSAEAEAWWHELLGPVMDETARSLSGSGRGHHYWFRLGEQEQRGRAAHRDTMKWDLRSEGGGVIAPPSGHKSGGEYVWEIGLDSIQPWPYPEIPGKGNASYEGAPDATSLAGLLANPGEGGRNNWVTAVLGHYAKRIPFEDGYRATAEMVWATAVEVESDHPYDRAEFEATLASVWGSERNKWKQANKPEPDTGWLSGDGRQLYCLTMDKHRNEAIAPFAQFDIDAHSMILGADGRTTYVVDVVRDTPTGVDVLPRQPLEAERLGSNDMLSKWMAARRMIVNPPGNDVGKAIARATRFQMYIEQQSPRKIRAAPHMGWFNDSEYGVRYVCNEGLIDATGLVSAETAGLIPDPRKTTEHDWHYGFEGESEQAAAILREVLTFHDSVTTSIFGAMWALAPLKGAVMAASSLFPHLAIIAPSESGKTNGFFDMMIQANGRRTVGGTYTAASLRDDLAVHRGGFVWIDDPANIDDLGDLLRSAANEGVHSRKGGNNWSDTIQTHLVAPIVLSAEGLEMLKERAMADRVIEIEVPSPVGRQSERGEYPQWDDVLRLQHRAGHLSNYAGHFVQRAFQWLESIGGEEGFRHQLLELRVGSGRQSEKLALVRLGARALAWVAGTSAWSPVSIGGWNVGDVGEFDPVALVDAWAIGESTQTKQGPYLVSVVMPTFLAHRGFLPRYKSVPYEPMFLDKDGHLRVNVAALAAWWQNHARGRSDRARANQLGGASALRNEAHAMGWISGTPIKGKRYSVVDIENTRQIMAEAGYDYESTMRDDSVLPTPSTNGELPLNGDT